MDYYEYSGHSRSKTKEFSVQTAAPTDKFVFYNRLRPILVTSHVGFAGSLAYRCAETPKGGRSAALPTYSTSTSPLGLTSHSRAVFELLGVVLHSLHPLSDDHLPFRAASLLGLVCVLLIPSRAALHRRQPRWRVSPAIAQAVYGCCIKIKTKFYPCIVAQYRLSSYSDSCPFELPHNRENLPQMELPEDVLCCPTVHQESCRHNHCGDSSRP